MLEITSYLLARWEDLARKRNREHSELDEARETIVTPFVWFDYEGSGRRPFLEFMTEMERVRAECGPFADVAYVELDPMGEPLTATLTIEYRRPATAEETAARAAFREADRLQYERMRSLQLSEATDDDLREFERLRRKFDGDR